MLEENSYDLLKSTKCPKGKAIQLTGKARRAISVNTSYRTTDFTRGEDVSFIAPCNAPLLN